MTENFKRCTLAYLQLTNDTSIRRDIISNKLINFSGYGHEYAEQSSLIGLVCDRLSHSLCVCSHIVTILY